MAWCQEFGLQVGGGCTGVMVAATDHCGCEECGTRCTGKFTGCRDVWARGPLLTPVVTGTTIARRPTAHTDHEPAAVPATEGDRVADVLGELVKGLERLAARQDELAARQDKLLAIASAPEHANESLQRQILAAQQETLASLTTHKLLLSAHQRALATLAAQYDRMRDQLATITGSTPAGASAEARQDFFLTRVEQLATQLAQLLGDARATPT